MKTRKQIAVVYFRRTLSLLSFVVVMIMSWVGMTRPLSIVQELVILLVYIGALALMFLENGYEKRIGFTDD
ncbi:MAG: hypothetical protein M3005_03450 [Apilactobacillus sp.]|uniref:hypothetical protein n=1 Tax=Apilactobacillus TaxID=2767877 RepID=UPI0025E0367B|nr:hypothetical protein [Apilactobacillus sp.]MCT6822911.1 hypothetical protein [Apilactobacillus sp.]MCT6858333.1 hypothetical protein [Apilactobacillus sp.]